MAWFFQGKWLIKPFNQDSIDHLVNHKQQAQQHHGLLPSLHDLQVSDAVPHRQPCGLFACFFMQLSVRYLVREKNAGSGLFHLCVRERCIVLLQQWLFQTSQSVTTSHAI